jgi:hypothetical protein
MQSEAGTTLPVIRSSVSRQRGRAVASKAEEYRRRARACLFMAGTMTSGGSRASFVEMAQVWTRLADEEDEAAPARVEERRPAFGHEHGQQKQQIQQQQQIQLDKKKGE